MKKSITDREIMLNTEKKANTLIAKMQSSAPQTDPSLISDLNEIRAQIHSVATGLIDYQIVVDHLDDGIFITDRKERILYVNPAYERMFDFSREELRGKTVEELLASRSYFTTSMVPEVIRDRRRVMRIATYPNNERPSMVVGVPIFDAEGEIQYIVVSIRSLSSYAELRDHFHTFLNSLRVLNNAGSAVKVYENSRMILGEESMVGASPAMQEIMYVVEKVHDTDASVLITGESGTGKELVANAIYNTSRRKNKPFIKVNCSSIPASLIESELFGYEKGAFSGANSAGKKGLFEAANTGTILLDEIGDMPLDAQAKLLRVLQNNEVTRVGGTKPIKLDIRVIASTNSHLKEKIKEGTFRRDLYYRLHIIPIHIPPLRERKDDIPLLCGHFLDLFSAKYHRNVFLSKENMELLQEYSWPGNIRELRNIMEYLVVCCSDLQPIDNSLLRGILDIEDEPGESGEVKRSNEAQEAPAPLSETPEPEAEPLTTMSEAVAQCERELLIRTMRRVHSMKEASQLLGIDISTVSRKLKQYGLTTKGEEA